MYATDFALAVTGRERELLSYDEELCLSPAGGWLFTIVYPKADISLVLTHSLLYH
jgi:hypothetical protein